LDEGNTEKWRRFRDAVLDSITKYAKGSSLHRL